MPDIKQLDAELIAEHERDFDGEPYPCGYLDYCNYCEAEDLNYPCAKAKMRMDGDPDA